MMMMMMVSVFSGCAADEFANNKKSRVTHTHIAYKCYRTAGARNTKVTIMVLCVCCARAFAHT